MSRAGRGVVTTECEGPLIWFECARPEDGAVLECAAQGCDYFIATGWWHRTDHAHTPWMKEGLAS